MKKELLFFALSAFFIFLLCRCNAKPPQTNENNIENPTSQEEVIEKPLFEKGQELATPNGKILRCLYSSEYSADFATKEWIDEKDALEFVNKNGLNQLRVSFSYDSLSALPNYVVITEGKASYNQDIPHTYAEAIKCEKEYIAAKEKIQQEELEKQEQQRKKAEESNKKKIIGKWIQGPLILCIYSQKGSYFIGTYENDNDINELYELKKLADNRFESVDGGDMPERFTITSDGNLTMMTYNPDVREWVFMGNLKKKK